MNNVSEILDSSELDKFVKDMLYNRLNLYPAISYSDKISSVLIQNFIGLSEEQQDILRRFDSSLQSMTASKQADYYVPDHEMEALMRLGNEATNLGLQWQVGFLISGALIRSQYNKIFFPKEFYYSLQPVSLSPSGQWALDMMVTQSGWQLYQAISSLRGFEPVEWWTRFITAPEPNADLHEDLWAKWFLSDFHTRNFNKPEVLYRLTAMLDKYYDMELAKNNTDSNILVYRSTRIGLYVVRQELLHPIEDSKELGMALLDLYSILEKWNKASKISIQNLMELDEFPPDEWLAEIVGAIDLEVMFDDYWESLQ